MYKLSLAKVFCSICLAVGLATPVQLAADQKSRVSEPRTDEAISREVRHRLLMLPYYSVFDNLAYSVNNGVVTLYGQVARPSLRPDAAATVKQIVGVQSVVNRIEVLPTSFNDDRLRRELFRSIYGFAPLQRYALQAVPPIHIIVKNGHATLVGVVATQADKNAAGIRANGVSGVFSVKNELRVERS